MIFFRVPKQRGADFGIKKVNIQVYEVSRLPKINCSFFKDWNKNSGVFWHSLDISEKKGFFFSFKEPVSLFINIYQHCACFSAPSSTTKKISYYVFFFSKKSVSSKFVSRSLFPNSIINTKL